MTKRTDRQVARGERIIDRLRSQMNREADADVGVALSASGAGQANLLAQTRAQTRSLLASQRGNSAAIRSLSARARAQQGVVAGQAAGARNRYGNALGDSIAQSFAPAGARAAGTGSVLRGYAGASRTARRTAGDVAAIAQAGVAAQGSAAEYAMAQALQQRAIVDNQTLAQLTGDLYQQAISYNQQWQLWKRQQDYAAKQAEKTGGKGARAQAEALMSEGATIAVDAANTWRDVRVDPDREGPPVIADLAAEWMAQNGYGPDDPQVRLYIATLRNISKGMDADTAYQNAAKTLFSSLPGFEKWGDDVISGGMQEISLQTTEAWKTFIAGNPGGGTDSGSRGDQVATFLFDQMSSGYSKNEAIARLIKAGIITQEEAEQLRSTTEPLGNAADYMRTSRGGS